MTEQFLNIHPIFVHFTVALVLLAVPFYFAATYAQAYSTRYQSRIVARWLLWLGAIFSVLTVAAGIYAFYTVTHDTPSHEEMTEHRNWAVVTFLMIVASVVCSLRAFRKQSDESKQFLWLISLTATLVLVTAWKGGELVYRYGLGVQSLPVAEGVGRAHEHDDENSHAHSDETMGGASMPGTFVPAEQTAPEAVTVPPDVSVPAPATAVKLREPTKPADVTIIPAVPKDDAQSKIPEPVSDVVTDPSQSADVAIPPQN